MDLILLSFEFSFKKFIMITPAINGFSADFQKISNFRIRVTKEDKLNCLKVFRLQSLGSMFGFVTICCHEFPFI